MLPASVEIGPLVTIGPSVTIGYGVTIGPSARIGHSVTLCPSARIGYGASIGDGVRIGYGASIGDGVRIGYGVTIGPRASIGDGASIGPSASIGHSVTIGGGEWFVSVGPQGSRNTMLTAVQKPDGLRWWVGCKTNITTEKLRDLVAKTHGKNDHAADYLHVIAFVEGHPGRLRCAARQAEAAGVMQPA
jgi:UDP-3-O-[3-hydroxymyristoyl] glucosamine N-acyltransferase